MSEGPNSVIGLLYYTLYSMSEQPNITNTQPLISYLVIVIIHISLNIMSRETFIAADIGGTNTRLLIYELRLDNSVLSKKLSQGQRQVLTIHIMMYYNLLYSSIRAPGTLLLQKKYQNIEFESFSDILKSFLKEAYVLKPPLSACFAVAGPVKDNVVRFTNRAAWTIDGYSIEKEFGIKKVRLINDFVANGYGLLTLDEDKECIALQKAKKVKSAPIACIGAGTGLGQCFLTPSNNEYQCFPSEGGHAEYAPRNDLEFGLLTFLKKKFEQKHRVSVERVVSGTGLANIHEYLCSIYPEKIDSQLQLEIDSAGDLKGAIIARASKTDELCRQTMEIFVTAYGAETGVAALKFLPYGGLYKRICRSLRSLLFRYTFCRFIFNWWFDSKEY